MNTLNWEKTGEKFNTVINNKGITLDVYKVNISNLKFNPYNTRIQDLIVSNSRFKSMEQDELRNSKEVQKFIYENLIKDHEEKENVRLKISIKNFNILSPLVSLKDGLLLSGNNRLSILKRMNDENFEFVKVALFPEELSKKEIIKSELILQNGIDIKLDYTNMAKVLISAKLYKEEYDYKEITEMIGLKAKDSVKIAELYNDFLYYVNLPEREDYYRSFNRVYSMLDSIKNLENNKKITKYERELLKYICFKLILSTRKEASVQTIRDNIKKIEKIEFFNDRKKILGEFNKNIGNITDEFVEKIADKNYENPNLAENYIIEAKEEIEIIDKKVHDEVKSLERKIEKHNESDSSIIENIRKKMIKNKDDLKQNMFDVKKSNFDNDIKINEIIKEIGKEIEKYWK